MSDVTKVLCIFGFLATSIIGVLLNDFRFIGIASIIFILGVITFALDHEPGIA